jgi:hypothetical protein
VNLFELPHSLALVEERSERGMVVLLGRDGR